MGSSPPLGINWMKKDTWSKAISGLSAVLQEDVS